MVSEGYGTWSARKLGSNLLCYGGKREEEKEERRKGVKGQSGKGNLNTMKKKRYIGKLWMNKSYYFCNRDTGLLLYVHYQGIGATT